MSDDAKSNETPPRQAAFSTAFNQALAALNAQCCQLMIAINNHDYEGVEHAAREAATMWLLSRAAFRRLIEGTKVASPYVVSALELLETARASLLKLFDIATKTIAVPRMDRALKQLRVTVEAATEELRSALKAFLPNGSLNMTTTKSVDAEVVRAPTRKHAK